MRSCGIVVEYNPFHNGHRYHAQQARELSGAEVIVAVMSGNFLQRGEPAIIDKWSRTQAALKNGVDLVVELPFAWAVQSADYFAKGSIKLLQALKCEALCFGTDSTAAFDYAGYGRFFIEEKSAIDQLFHELPIGWSYPEKMAEVVSQLYPKAQDFPPNHLLGLSYAKENATYNQPMEIFPLPRKDQGYHDASLVTDQFASATGIRQAVLAGGDYADFVPVETLDTLRHTHISWTDFWPYLDYQLRASSLTTLQEIYQMNEGLEHRLVEQGAKNFPEFLQAIRTKRYTQPRLQRLLTYVLLQVKTAEIKAEQEHTMLHVLGFTDQGKKYLNQIKKQVPLPIAAKIGQKEKKNHFLTYRADQIYQLIHPEEQTIGRFPLRA
ncbi:nucleotidyltransferase [Enterococcus dongliensis]|uniref:nucleotidyltransferase n=1 Tax=Enterococcus dongliensis TaxID=2559925 RepID=UPI002890916B|nr:nucleotidyltransferase [Enterococcus dongliensis]MDT2612393.1 nucleotidyltransferase [Enterococcus dongliensis]MDT2638863.1 nucleotidyltransferase [Enterococcus dongliensis]MDT2668405.1 nucleotidyltransferase [Enterococcus dongliensis]MDT2701949.1 nucleotidyltransferase [Enterococcus dongliensis]